ncbi:hypothetical protein [Methylotuvimicrobium sp. KM1]|uniref:hypothetical protein n=1 Tax=Methylotuvimicrobium sp. KM1 TaxID=3377707 RepID=UPI00384C8BCC
MNPKVLAVMMIVFASLAACTAEPVRDAVDEEIDAFTVYQADPIDVSEEVPSPTHVKGGRELSLVRVMEGGVCKNEREGVEGLFLLYADTDDVERIKITEGAQIFGDFEREIEAIAAMALQETLKGIYLGGDSIFPDSPTSQQNMLNEFELQFVDTIESAIDDFQQKTTLTIDILPFLPSLYFYSEGCELGHDETGE